MGSNVGDEIDCSSFIDHIDDLIEFPPVNGCGNGLSSTDCKDFPSVWHDDLPDSHSIFIGSHRHSASNLSPDSVFIGSHRNSASGLSAELSVPGEWEVVKEIHKRPTAERRENVDSQIDGNWEDGGNKEGNVVVKTSRMPILVLELELLPPSILNMLWRKILFPRSC